MPKRLLLIGEGDDCVADWSEGFEKPMATIKRIIQDASRTERRIDWKLVIPDIEEWRGLSKRALRSARPETFLERLGGVHISHESWGGDNPGRSGVWVKVEIERKRQNEILALLSELADRLRANYPLNEPPL